PVAVGYAWRFGELGTSVLADPVFTFPDDTGRYYPVQLVVRNFLGCADSTMRLVTVEDVFLVHVPTAFTPDADGRNDVLYVVGNDISEADFKWMIFDRWGGKVYESTDPHAGWDGRYGGKPVKNGVYVWMLRAQSRFTKVNRDFRGHVTVVR
ncbi:MAG: gliding motility-associated C-terminal domain-containing protein, partial [Bacteroidetes bacterium]|nr:gliding motility-associated C-terminal domain-containing protein [Bacteroidota bacterium]